MQNTENGARTVYLIRHGHTTGDKLCISATDIPLDEFGVHQAARLQSWAAKKKLTAVYSSPLKRAAETARSLGKLPVIICGDLREASVGEWEGLAFDEIKRRYAEDFIRRGEHPGTIPPPGGESLLDAGLRLLNCLDRIIRETNGDIAVVSHGGAFRGALCRLLGSAPDEVLSLPQPWGGISELEISPEGQISVKSVGEMPDMYPDERSVMWLRDRYKMPERVRAHCDAVSKKAAKLASVIDSPVDIKLLISASALHDISRERGFSHAEDGARLMRDSGYPAVSDIIACHHDLPDGARIEAQILYLADKLVQEDREVTLSERFEESKKRCNTREALTAWQRRYDSAVSVARKLGLEVYVNG